MAIHLDIFSRSPEIAESAVMRIGASVWTVQIAKGHVLRRVSETHDLSVEANPDINVVITRLEENSISAITELAMVPVAADLMENVINSLLSTMIIWIDDLDVVGVPVGRIWLCRFHKSD